MAITVASLVIYWAICCAIVWIIIWHFRRRRLYKLASKFQGPQVFPLIGNAYQFFGNGEYLINKVTELVDSYSSPFRIWMGPIFAVYVCGPEQLQAICYSPKTLGRGEMFTNYCRSLLGTGLLSAPVPKWKVHRKLIQPTFHAKILDSFVQTFATRSKTMTDIMERNLDGSEFRIFSLVAFCTLDMVCETAMGVEGGAQANQHSSYVRAIQKVGISIGDRLRSLWLHPDFIFERTKLGKDLQEQIKSMHEFTDNVIRMKRNKLLERGSQPDSDDQEDEAPWESTPRRKVFLDHLMTLPSGSVNLTDEELRAEVDTMVLGGTETTAITNTFAMLMLASHKDVQEKVYQELYEIYGNDDIAEQPVRPKDLSRMKYLERVLKETMRLFPAIPYGVREVTDDLHIGDYTLPSGSFAIMGILQVQRSKKYWPDPLKFDPDRFLPENVAKRHPCAYMPFSAGPRNCVGFNYAMVSMKTLLATVLRRYILKKDNILPVKDIRLKMEIVLKPVDPIKIRIERRTGN